MTLSLTMRQKPNAQAPPRVARLVTQLEQIVYMGKLGLSASMSTFTLENEPYAPLANNIQCSETESHFDFPSLQYQRPS
jgi:hypothetical protein